MSVYIRTHCLPFRAPLKMGAIPGAAHSGGGGALSRWISPAGEQAEGLTLDFCLRRFHRALSISTEIGSLCHDNSRVICNPA